MNNKFDELSKRMAQSVTRRAALKKFGIGLAGIALACFGLGNKAEADPRTKTCLGAGTLCGTKAAFCKHHCCSGQFYFGFGEYLYCR